MEYLYIQVMSNQVHFINFWKNGTLMSFLFVFLGRSLIPLLSISHLTASIISTRQIFQKNPPAPETVAPVGDSVINVGITDSAEYEMTVAEIFEHFIAVIPEFGLRLFQNPAGI